MLIFICLTLQKKQLTVHIWAESFDMLNVTRQYQEAENKLQIGGNQVRNSTKIICSQTRCVFLSCVASNIRKSGVSTMHACKTI